MKKPFIISLLLGTTFGVSHLQAQNNAIKHREFWKKVSHNASSSSKKQATKQRPTVDDNCYLIASSKYVINSQNALEYRDSAQYFWHNNEGLGVDVYNDYGNFFEFGDSYTELFTTLNELPIYMDLDFPRLSFTEAPLMDSLKKFDNVNIASKYTFDISNNRVDAYNAIGGTTYSYEYDNNGNLVKQIYHTLIGNTTDSAVYNANNQLVAHYKFESLSPSREFNTFTYDNNGALIVRDYTYETNGVIDDYYIDSLFTLSATKDSIVTSYLNVSSNIVEPNLAAVYYHNNNLVDSIHQTYLDFNQTDVIYLNRESSGRLNNLLVISDGDTAAGVTAIYDNSDNMTEFYFSSYYLGEWEYYGRTLNTYDSLNNLTRVQTFDYLDPTSQTWTLEEDNHDLHFYYAKEDTGLSIAKVPSLELNAFPNPTSDNITVSVANNNISAITVYNASGRVVKLMTLPANTTKHTISTAELPTGAYLLKVEGKNSQGVTKFIKQ